MKVSHALRAFALLGIAAVVAASCAGPPAAPAPAPTPAAAATPSPIPAKTPRTPPAKVRAGIVKVDSDAPFIIAKERGYFQELGLDVELVVFDNLARQIPALAAGQLEVGRGPTGASLFNAVLQGIKMKIVADAGSLTQGHGYAAIVLRKDLFDSGAVKSIADLKGKKVATSGKGTSSHMVIDLVLGKAGLKAADYEVVELPPAQMVTAIARKAIDAAFLPEPAVSQMVKQGTAVRWQPGDVIAAGEHIAVLVYAGEWAEKNPDVARDFMIGYLRGLRDYNNAFDKNVGKDTVLDILTKATGIPRDLYEAIVKNGFDPDGKLDPKKLEAQQDWYVKNGFQKEKVDLGKVLDLSYVENALKVLGPYQR